MARCRRPVDDASDSDVSFLPEEDKLFDIKDHSDDLTKPTDIKDLGEDDNDDDNNNDDKDDNKLFGGNTYPPEYYHRGMDDSDDSKSDSKDYSPRSKRQLNEVEGLWQQFCTDILRCDSQECFKSISTKMLHRFFDWYLNQKVSQNGRRKQGTKKKSSLGTRWKVFRLMYKRAMGEKLNGKLNRKMHKVLEKLAKKHRLSSKQRENRCMTIDTLKEEIHTTLSTTKKLFDLSELHILAMLFLLLLTPASACPTSILRLRFSDIQVMVARNPGRGPYNILIWFTLEFTKTYLGEKDV